MGTIEKHALENVISILFSDDNGVVLKDKLCDVEYSLSPGVTFDDGHYGFNIIVDKNGSIDASNTYSTLCQIYGVQQLSNGELIIYEVGKTMPWRFSKNGEFIHEAKYLPTSDRDRKHALEHFGATPESNPEIFQDTNQQRKKIGKR